jgi:hypothetical protein
LRNNASQAGERIAALEAELETAKQVSAHARLAPRVHLPSCQQQRKTWNPGS